MIVKLKSLEQVVKEFGFKNIGDGDYCQIDSDWCIIGEMHKYFGREVEVFKYEYNSAYDYRLRDGEYTWYFIHSSWFEPEEFIKKEEFMI